MELLQDRVEKIYDILSAASVLPLSKTQIRKISKLDGVYFPKVLNALLLSVLLTRSDKNYESEGKREKIDYKTNKYVTTHKGLEFIKKYEGLKNILIGQGNIGAYSRIVEKATNPNFRSRIWKLTGLRYYTFDRKFQEAIVMGLVAENNDGKFSSTEKGLELMGKFDELTKYLNEEPELIFARIPNENA